MNMRARLLSLLAVFPAQSMAGPPAPGWAAFWAAHRVSPPPPRNLLQASGLEAGRIRNLTNGKLPDATVRRWVHADLRRGAADRWAMDNLRADIANAGVFGPPGLNGTSEEITAQIERAVVRIESDGRFDMLAAAVVSVTKDQQRASPHAGLADFVIVFLRRSTGKRGTRIFRDGHVEKYGKQTVGELRCQIDTGHFFQDATLGPLWYQKDGWTAFPHDGTGLGEICGLMTKTTDITQIAVMPRAARKS